MSTQSKAPSSNGKRRMSQAIASTPALVSEDNDGSCVSTPQTVMLWACLSVSSLRPSPHPISSSDSGKGFSCNRRSTTRWSRVPSGKSHMTNSLPHGIEKNLPWLRENGTRPQDRIPLHELVEVDGFSDSK